LTKPKIDPRLQAATKAPEDLLDKMKPQLPTSSSTRYCLPMRETILDGNSRTLNQDLGTERVYR
jgi:hypothetical protein